METPILNGALRLGVGVGSDLRKRLRRATKSIYVLSPYLSSSLVEDLLAAQRKGVQVHLLTSDSQSVLDALREKQLYRKLLHQHKTALPAQTILKLVALLVLGLLTMLSFGATFNRSPWFAVLSALGLAAFIIALRLRTTLTTYTPTFTSFAVFCSQEGVLATKERGSVRRLVHAKVFIVDDTVYLGSLNLTYRGFHSNYESLVEIADPAVAQAITAELDKLRTSKDLAMAELTELGDRLYQPSRRFTIRSR